MTAVYKLSEPAVLRNGPPKFTTEKDRGQLPSGVDRSIKLYAAGEEIEYEGLPGPHMLPVNDEAKEMYSKHPPAAYLDFTQHLDINAGDNLAGPTDGQIMSELRQMVAGRARKTKAAE